MKSARFGMLALVTLLFASKCLHAERYALLVGVGKYQNGITGLDGPEYDVQALRALLIRKGYKSEALVTLLNDQATRAQILEALRNAVAKLHSGDHLIFYYSGHGTSAFDQKLAWLSPAIGPDSGALATYDLSLSSYAAAAESLLIGRRDLRPILSRVPAGAYALVLLDACYSENAAKSVSIFQSAPVRGINLVEAVKDRTTPSSGVGSPPPPPGGAESGTYPYANVAAVSAASKDQPALDINAAAMASRPDWRTVDGKPHGALTNTLLEALSGSADTNHDGNISYDEMFRYTRRRMERFPHQPQLLSSNTFPLAESALGAGDLASPSAAPVQVAPPQGKYRVAVEDHDPAITSAIRALPEIELGTNSFDLLVRKQEKGWALFDSSGVLIQTVGAEPPAQIARRVLYQARLAKLRSASSPQQTFNVQIDAEAVDGDTYDRLRTVFRVGEPVRFRISTEKPAYLLLLGIDKDGRVTVLFPGPPAKEHARQSANQRIEFVVKATPPSGSEQLKLIAFSEQPERWSEWTCSEKSCPSFSPTDPQIERLIQLVNGNTRAAETSLRVITR